MSRTGLRQLALPSAVVLVLMLAWAPLAAGQGSVAPRQPISPELAAMAAEEVLNYARVQYPVDGRTEQGMPFRLGGQTTLEEFLEAVQNGADPRSMGVDASGLVVNVYRSVIPELTFLMQGGSGLVEATDVSSSALFYWNVNAVDVDEAMPGDLLFFKGSGGEPSGVAIVTRVSPDRVDFVVASSSRGRVIETFARPGGAYWQGNVLGLGRLLIP
ncbi:MAG TPA: NlpC/P60 family protein [Limnochorda sp.]